MTERDGGGVHKQARGRAAAQARFVRLIPAAALVGILVAALVAMPNGGANPGVRLGVFPQFPTQVNLGATGVAASISVVNGSDGIEGVGPITLTDLTLVPSCGNFTATCAGGADPGVFQLSATGTGAVGTACSLRPFNITVIDPATGRVRF